jgi:hypothetical protein
VRALRGSVPVRDVPEFAYAAIGAGSCFCS